MHIQDIALTLAQAFPDVDQDIMASLTATYVRHVARAFRPNEPYIWIEPRIISWTTLRNRCGVFVSGGHVLTVLDAFHRAAPLMAIVRQNSNFEKFSVSAVMLYPELMLLHIKPAWLLGVGDPRYLKTRDQLIHIYVNGPALEPAVRLKPAQARRMMVNDRACVD